MMMFRKTVKNVSAEYMLRLIVKFLNRRDQESENLWYVLSALRGPDKDRDYKKIKYITTARIRGVIGILPWADCLVDHGPIVTDLGTERGIVGSHFI